MKLLITRNHKTAGMIKKSVEVSFTSRLEMTPEEKAHMEKYQLNLMPIPFVTETTTPSELLQGKTSQSVIAASLPTLEHTITTHTNAVRNFFYALKFAPQYDGTEEVFTFDDEPLKKPEMIEEAA